MFVNTAGGYPGIKKLRERSVPGVKLLARCTVTAPSDGGRDEVPGVRSFFPVGIDDVPPIQIPPSQSLDQDFCRGHIGGERDQVLVAKTLDLVDLIKAILAVGITKEDHQIDLVISDAGADLLAAPLISMKV